MKIDKTHIMLAFSVLILSILIGYDFNSKPNEIGTVIVRDTTLKVDTLWKERPLKIVQLPGRLDTLYLPDSTKIITAEADSVLTKDSSTVKVTYYFPPLNKFDILVNIKEKVIEKLKTITEVKTITLESPWYKNEWFWVSIIEGILIIVSLL